MQIGVDHLEAASTAAGQRSHAWRLAAGAGLILLSILVLIFPGRSEPSAASSWLPIALALGLFAAPLVSTARALAAAVPAIVLALWLTLMVPASTDLRVIAVAGVLGMVAFGRRPRRPRAAWIAAVAGSIVLGCALFARPWAGDAPLLVERAAYLLIGVWLMSALRHADGGRMLGALCAAGALGLGVLGVLDARHGTSLLAELGTQLARLPLQSSIALLLCGFALARIDRPRDPWALLALAAASAMAVLAILAAVFEGAGGGVVATARLGWMPVATATVILLVVAGMQAVLLARSRSRLLAFAWLAGVVAIGLSLVVLAGYLLDLRDVRELGTGAAMSPGAALGLLLMGIGLAAMEGEDAAQRSRREAWLPALAAIAGVLVSLGLWDAARDGERKFRAAADEAALTAVVNDIDAGLSNRARAFRRLGQRLARRPLVERLQEFEADLRDYLDATSRITLAAYYDDRGQLLAHVDGLSRHGADDWLRLHDARVQQILAGVRVRHEPMLGRPVAREGYGYSAFLAVPLIEDARVSGFLALELDLDAFVAAAVADVDPAAHLRVEQDDHVLYRQGPVPDRLRVRDVDLLGGVWRIGYSAPRESDFGRASTLILGSGLLATVLLAVALRQSTLARRRRIEAERALAHKRQIVDSSRDVIGSLDGEGWFTEVNAACQSVWGYRPEQLIGRPYLDLVEPSTRERVHAELVAVHAGQTLPPSSHECLARDGRRVAIEWSIDRSSELGRLVFVCRDVTESRRIEAELDRMLTHDRVTGLPRHAIFEQALQREIQAASGPIAVFFINLDHFHGVNESLGRDVGDQALREVARRLQALGDGGLRIARYAGDEFGAYVANQDAHAARALAERLRELVAKPVEGDGFRIFLTASVGLSRYPHDGATAGDLIRRAELAMKQVKSEGRDQIAEFSLEQMRELEERLTLGAKLRAAVERGELRLHYQPQYDARSGRLTGAEALLRWHSPTLGTIPPGRFIPVAESLGLMPELGRWVLDEACRQAREWLDRSRHAVPVSVNVSALQLQRPDFVDQVQMALVKHRLPGGAIDLELTESALMENVDRVQRMLADLKALGVTLSLDDFGTGYSSLAYLRQFKLDKLKIDRSFVADLPEVDDAAVIARTIIAVAHQLRMRVAAEGVETEAQRRFLVDSACDELQGYLFARPVPAAEFASLLETTATAGMGSPPGIA